MHLNKYQEFTEFIFKKHLIDIVFIFDSIDLYYCFTIMNHGYFLSWHHTPPIIFEHEFPSEQEQNQRFQNDIYLPNLSLIYQFLDHLTTL
jgi:hypothetical protein